MFQKWFPHRNKILVNYFLYSSIRSQILLNAVIPDIHPCCSFSNIKMTCGFYLWAALWSPHLWSSEAVGPEQVFLRSFSGRSCCRRWLCRTPGFSGLRRHCGGHRSSGGPAGPPAVECLPAAGSEGRGRKKELLYADNRGKLKSNRSDYAFVPTPPTICQWQECHTLMLFYEKKLILSFGYHVRIDFCFFTTLENK